MQLAEILRAKGIKQSHLASEAGVSEPTVSRWVRGTSLIPTQKLRAVASVLGVTIEDLVPSRAPSERTAA